MGIEFTESGARYLRGTVSVDSRTPHAYGLMHGDTSVALLLPQPPAGKI